MGTISRVCASCGERRIGQFRYCLACGADFEPRHDDDASMATGTAADGDAPSAGAGVVAMSAAVEAPAAQWAAGAGAATVPAPGLPTGDASGAAASGSSGPLQRPGKWITNALVAAAIALVAVVVVLLAILAIQPPA